MYLFVVSPKVFSMFMFSKCYRINSAAQYNCCMDDKGFVVDPWTCWSKKNINGRDTGEYGGQRVTKCLMKMA